MTPSRLVACSLALLLSACTAEAPEFIGERESAIVNGTLESGHPSVGMLEIGTDELCTATLIGKKTVITAAHCIGTSHVFVIAGGSYPAVRTVRHPNWDSYYLTNDVALVILGQAPPVAPTPIAVTAPSVGMAITLVGFGVSSENGEDSGQKRLAHNKVSSMNSTTFSFTGSGGSMGSTCYGDSGGPAFATINGVEVQVGVTSNGQQPCGTLATDTRVDAYVGWISQAAGGDVNQGTTTPADTTPPSVSIASPAAGARIPTSTTVVASIQDNVKAVKAELLVDGKLVGSLQAAPWQFAITLTPGAHALQVSAYDAANNKGIASVTVTADDGSDPASAPDPNNPAPGEYGATCQGAADCKNGLCAEDSATQGSYCTQACDPEGAACPLGAGCFAGADGDGSFCGAPMNSLPSQSDEAPADTSLVGGCSVSGRPSPSTLLPLLIAMLGIFVARRRR